MLRSLPTELFLFKSTRPQLKVLGTRTCSPLLSRLHIHKVISASQWSEAPLRLDISLANGSSVRRKDAHKNNSDPIVRRLQRHCLNIWAFMALVWSFVVTPDPIAAKMSRKTGSSLTKDLA